MSKLGMKPVGGIHRVTVKKAKNVGLLARIFVLGALTPRYFLLSLLQLGSL
jgi:NACalpha-BTF3-like transcription factor